MLHTVLKGHITLMFEMPRERHAQDPGSGRSLHRRQGSAARHLRFGLFDRHPRRSPLTDRLQRTDFL